MSTPPLENEGNFRALLRERVESGYSLQESLLQFLPLEATTGKNVADTHIHALQKQDINCYFPRDQGYDGAASMSGKFRGTRDSKGLYAHCFSLSLNLAISNSSDVTSIRNCYGTIRKLYDFFTTQRLFCNKKLQLCPTKWVERHESVMVVVQLLQPVAATLEEITEWGDKNALSNAFILLNAIGQPDFIRALLSAEKLLSYILPLRKKLQATDADLASALPYADDINSVLTRIRENAETEFKILFRECEETARNIGLQITIPKLVHRANVSAENVEEYFRCDVFIQWPDGLISNLHARFAKHKEILTSFLFPKCACSLKNIFILTCSTSTSERTFSTLRRIKNYLRNTMSDTRLNGLANLNIHREIPIDQEKVIDNLVLKGPRRLNFVL
ncbi:hypothetical protein PR048_004764 [Dryococelus australis]|uniref:HAT C-terminal dimerisation domain-containing protein n=1 Tax=Dryococelus australis TaxID=614101 RepID=A0ABQ9I6C1_9NEOP|nr:hypothetical protein PR048_004764 [Dryococelus australis]